MTLVCHPDLENGQPLFISEVAHFIRSDYVGNKVKCVASLSQGAVQPFSLLYRLADPVCCTNHRELLDTEDYVKEHTYFDTIETVREVRSYVPLFRVLFLCSSVFVLTSRASF